LLTIIDNRVGAELVERPRAFIGDDVLINNVEADIIEIATNTAEIVPVNANNLNMDVLVASHRFPNGYNAI